MVQTTKALRQDNQSPSWTFNYLTATHNHKALSWHHHTFFTFLLFMAGTRTQRINRTWCCTRRGGSVYNTAVTGTEFSIIYSKDITMTNVRAACQDWTVKTSIICCAFRIQHYWYSFITRQHHVISCCMINEQYYKVTKTNRS
jgi:hypothetical protein